MPNQNTLAYLKTISKYFKDEMSSEMTYRTAFQNYLESIFPPNKGYYIQHDPKAVGGNKPDYIILSSDKVPLLYIEVKEIGKDLDKVEKSSQATRYFGYTNLIISDYVEFRFYRNGERYQEPIALGQINKSDRSIASSSDNGDFLAKTVLDFMGSHKEPIKSGKHLAKIMGGKAQRIRDNTLSLLKSDTDVNDELSKIMRVIKENLVADLNMEKFADLYAQTLVYGLFAARYCDPTQEDFSRQEARELIPPTNPFLRDFFDHIAGPSFPKALSLIVDELCEVFTHADVSALMGDYYKIKNDSFKIDPVIHFYEDFLQEYDPEKKIERGVFYTPPEVVGFIVRGVNQILEEKFNISNGLANNEKITNLVETVLHKGKIKKIDKEFHKVQILDFATGTGTFLNEIIKHVHKTFSSREGMWKEYVKSDLVPRLHGFELMMASYTIAHLKLGMTLQNTCGQVFNQRLGIYLTNTLNEATHYSGQHNIFGFMESISMESQLASQVKKEYPVMVVVGNPPYSGESMNPQYTGNNVYKVEPGGKEKLKERNSKWLNDDYVKFISFAEQMIEKNGEGVIGIISAHGYIDNPTFRGMRWHLRKTFDEIYVLNLHGNTNKKERSPDGGVDQNVFDIRTGVAVLFCVKKKATSGRKALAKLFQYDVFGKRKEKFKYLEQESIQSIAWNELPTTTDVWKIEGEGKSKYEKGFSLDELFTIKSVGIVTARDGMSIQDTKQEIEKVVNDFKVLDEELLREKYSLGKDVKEWSVSRAKKDVMESSGEVAQISYRPFDSRWTYYTGNSKGFLCRARSEVMDNLLHKGNTALLVTKAVRDSIYSHVFVTNRISEAIFLSGTTSTNALSCPLYLIDENGHKIPNLSNKIWDTIKNKIGDCSPEEVLDYVYAVLHSNGYRKKYDEFLKVGFPRVPYPDNKDIFQKLASLGTKLRELHLLDVSEVTPSITTYPISGSNTVEKQNFNAGDVYINTEQYFGGVSEEAWNFNVGGYQPLQKYLKSRKGKILTLDEIQNYEKMVVAITKTIEIMNEIDDIYTV